MPEPIAQRVAEVVPPRIPRGMDLLDTPLLNKGTAFTDGERTQFGLHGLLPPHVETLEEQVLRAYERMRERTTIWSATSICALCRTITRFSFIDFFSSTSRK